MTARTPDRAEALTAIVCIGAFLAFLGAFLFLALRDNAAVDRCEDLGGQTWDSGQHCVVGDYRVISTRGGVWDL